MLYREFPNMRCFLKNYIPLCSHNKQLLVRYFARQQCFGQEPYFALASGYRGRLSKPEKPKT